MRRRKGSIAAQEKKLFAEWEKVRRPFFVRDGVVCEKAYNDSRPKIAFVMKEYAQPYEGYDLREEELRNPFGPGWHKVAKILQEIRRIDNPRERRWENGMQIHPSICAFNLSKQGGNPYTDMVRLALIAMDDREFIRRQFKIYDPDLTICGGTYQIFRYVCGHEEDEEKQIKRRGLRYPFYERSPGKYVLGIHHPASPGQSDQGAISAVKNVLERMKHGYG